MSKPNFLQFMQEKDQLDEAFNSAPYELTMGKKNAGDVFFTFIDEDEKEYRIQFYTPQGLGKNVRQVFIGQKRGSTYPDMIARFKNPMRVIASMIEATKQFLATPLGKTIDGYAVNFSKKALDRGMTLIPKIVRQSGLKQKLNVMDLTYAPVPDRGYVWLVKKGKDPAQVFDGPKMQGITWDDPDKVGDVPDQAARDTALQGDIADLSATTSNQMSSGGKLAHMWTYTLAGNPGEERFPLMTFGADKSYTVFGSPKTKSITGTHYGQKYTGTSLDAVLKKIGASMPTNEMIKQFKDDMANPANKGGSTSSVNLRDNGWTNQVAPNGNPHIDYRDGKGMLLGGIGLRFSSIYGMYSGSSKAVNFKEIEGADVAEIAQKLKLPAIPNDVLNKFTSAAESWWNSKNIMPASRATAAELTTDRWRTLVNAFYKVKEMRGVSSRTMASGSVTFGGVGAVTATLNRGVTKAEDPVFLTVKAVTELGPRGETIGQPIVIRDIDIARPSKLTAIVQAAVDKLAPLVTVSSKKTGVDLAAYAGSIRDNAPKGRDLDWQIYASRDGQTLNVAWDITFRRNTTEGAFREFKAQIDRANQYLQTLYQDAKSKGYNPTEPNLMTLSRAQRSDEWAASNGESAYSEYEQSLGGNMQIKI